MKHSHFKSWSAKCVTTVKLVVKDLEDNIQIDFATGSDEKYSPSCVPAALGDVSCTAQKRLLNRNLSYVKSRLSVLAKKINEMEYRANMDHTL